MCLGVPAKIISIDGEMAMANINGASLEVGIQLIDDVKPGDYVLVHTGYALEKLNEQEALETLETIKKLQEPDPENPTL